MLCVVRRYRGVMINSGVEWSEMGCGEEGAEQEKWRRQSRIAQSRIK